MSDDVILDFAREEAAGLPIVLKVSPAPGDGYKVEPDAQGYVVTGRNARSCLYGVYHVQQGRMPGAFSPAFSTRGINTCESLARHTPDELRLLIDRMGKWRMNALVVHVNYGWRRQRRLIAEECAKRGIDLVYYVYTSIAFLPPDSPARWFAKAEDGRPLTRQVECETRPCVSEPEALEAFRQGARAFFRAGTDPAVRIIATTGDGYGHCRCPRCRSLSPAEQWRPLLERFIAAGRELAADKELESLIYVQRFRPPADMGLYRRLDSVLFDDHLRMRWRPLGEAHPLTLLKDEAEADPAVATMPINVYLGDRLREWREQFREKLCVFHNLQLHSALSCPQPNTAVLLEDFRRWRRMGVDGVLFEALNGMHYFVAQLGTLSEALWDPDVRYLPTRTEQWCFEHCPPGALFFLKSWDFPWNALQGESDDILRIHMHNVREFYDSPTAANLFSAIEHAYRQPDRIDRLNLAFRFLKTFHQAAPWSGLSAAESRFLTMTKLWDFMEPLENPIGETDAVIRGLLGKLR